MSSSQPLDACSSGSEPLTKFFPVSDALHRPGCLSNGERIGKISPSRDRFRDAACAPRGPLAAHPLTPDMRPAQGQAGASRPCQRLEFYSIFYLVAREAEKDP